MPSIVVTPAQGGEFITQGLQNIMAAVPLIGRKQVYLALVRTRTKMKKYPPAMPKQKYKRTGTLQRSWLLKREGPDAYSLSADPRKYGHANKSYAQYVVGDEYGDKQTRAHARRWPLFRDTLEEEIQNLPVDVVKALKILTLQSYEVGEKKKFSTFLENV